MALRVRRRNSLANLSPGVAKQFIGCNSRGQVIGDCVLYDLGDQTYELTSSMPLLNWVEYHAQSGDWDVTTQRDNNTSDNPAGRRLKFRYQLDGPAASEIFDAVVDGETQPAPGQGHPGLGHRRRAPHHALLLRAGHALQVRATVAPAPYATAVRQMMRSAVGPSAG